MAGGRGWTLMAAPMCSRSISFLAGGAQRRRNTLFSLRRISRHIRQPTHFSHPELLAKDERKNNIKIINNKFSAVQSYLVYQRQSLETGEED